MVREEVVELVSETRGFRGSPERRVRRGQITQPLTRVPLLDWPADLFARGAAIVETMAEDCSAMWYGSHIQDVHA